MEGQIQSLTNRPKLAASATSPLAKREEIMVIIARLSNQADWPAEEELVRIRTRRGNN